MCILCKYIYIYDYICICYIPNLKLICGTCTFRVFPLLLHRGADKSHKRHLFADTSRDQETMRELQIMPDETLGLMWGVGLFTNLDCNNLSTSLER